MPEISVDVSEDVALLAEQLERDEVRDIVTKALRERSTEELMFDLADDVLQDSDLTDDDARKLGDELKERVAQRHGIGG